MRRTAPWPSNVAVSVKQGDDWTPFASAKVEPDPAAAVHQVSLRGEAVGRLVRGRALIIAQRLHIAE